MPRDANGLYSLPLPAVAAGTTITTLWGNTTTQDIAAALTDSLSRTAQGGMSGPLRLISGTVGAPSLAFVDQVGLGLYRSASGVMSFATAGTAYVRFNAANQLEVFRDEGGGDQWEPVTTTTALNALAARPPPKMTVFTVDDPAWVPTVGVRSMKVIITGGGGGGGGADGNGADSANMGGGGGGGGTCIKMIQSPIGASYAITIGAAGLGGAGAGGLDGATGGTSTFVGTGANLVASGGGSGNGMNTTLIAREFGGRGGTASGGDIDTRGNAGAAGVQVSGEVGSFGNGGSSFWGSGARAAAVSASSGDAGQNGGGGGGGFTLNVAEDSSGGNGGVGICVVEEYF